MYFKPEISTSQVKNSNYELPQAIKINANSIYPKLDFKQDQLVRLEINGKSREAKNSYQFKATDLQEGENTIKITKIQTIYLAKLVASKPTSFKLFVDRIAPELKLSEPTNKYVFLADYEIKVLVEPELKIELQQDDGSYKLLKQFTNQTGEQGLIIPTQPADNQYLLRAVDSFGNSSQPSTVKYYAFKRDGFEAINCESIVYPYNKTLWQYGFKNYPGKPCVKNGKETRITLQPRGASYPCSGPCDANPNYLSISIYAGNKTSALQNLLFSPVIISRQPLTTKAMLSGELIHHKTSSSLGAVEVKVFSFEKNEKTYLIAADYGGVSAVGNRAKLEDEFSILYEHFLVQ